MSKQVRGTWTRLQQQDLHTLNDLPQTSSCCFPNDITATAKVRGHSWFISHSASVCVCVHLLQNWVIISVATSDMWRIVHILAYLCSACVVWFTQQEEGSCFHLRRRCWGRIGAAGCVHALVWAEKHVAGDQKVISQASTLNDNDAGLLHLPAGHLPSLL